MKKSIWPSAVDGVVAAPPSKSVAQRAIALAALASGESVIYETGASDDVLAATGIIKALGVEVCRKGNALHITGGRLYPKQTLHCGESGLCLRMFAGIAASFEREVTLTGRGSLLKRPLDDVVENLSALGVACLSNNGFAPLTIRGPMHGGRHSIDASHSSQLLSGLLMAAPLLNTDTTLVVENLVSKPYVELTIDVMRAFGVQIMNKGFREFVIKAGQNYKPSVFRVEGDWSSAAFMLVAGVVAGAATVQKLNKESLQADKKILDVLDAVGVRCKYAGDSFRANRQEGLRDFDFDATDCPDLFPPLVALAANCKGESRITGVGRLHSKESNRAKSLSETFAKLGIHVRIEEDALVVRGGKITGGTVSAHGDHRIAMSAAIAALTADGPVHITGADAVNKSYPGFFDDLEKIVGGSLVV